MNILVILLVLIAIPLVLAALLANEYVVERDIIIHQSSEKVFGFIRFLQNGNCYNKWMMTDPHHRKTLTGTDGTKGFIYAWDSNNKNAGKGEQEITAMREGKRIDYEIRFEKPFRGVSHAYMETEPVQTEQTRVKWVFKGNRNYAMKIFHLLLNIKKMLEKDMQTSLDNLKRLLEK